MNNQKCECGCAYCKNGYHCRLSAFAGFSKAINGKLKCQKSESPATPKLSDSNNSEKAKFTFRKIASKAANMAMMAANAGGEESEEKRDKAMEFIIKLNEQIEELYSNNWH